MVEGTAASALTRPETIGSVGAILSAIVIAAALIGIALAWMLYLRNPGLPEVLAEKLRGLYRIVAGKYYVDEIYDLIITRPLFWGSTYVLYRGVDSLVIGGIVDGTGLTFEESGEGLRKLETGNVQHYAFVYLLGVLMIAAYYIYLVMR